MTDGPHQRRCWDCGNVAEHADSIVPAVLCTKCGSQDTRRLKRLEPQRYPDYQTTLPGELLNVDTLQDNGKAAAWEAIWDWCAVNGLPEHSFERQAVYERLNGPQMVCQWIIDLKEANHSEPTIEFGNGPKGHTAIVRDPNSPGDVEAGGGNER